MKHEVEIKLEKEWLDAIDAAYKKKSKDVEMDGFRKGHVPKDVYIKKNGLESLYGDAIDICINTAYKKALEEEKLVPACEPQVDVTGISDTNVIFKFTIITKPEVTLGEYKNLGIKKEKVKVTNEEITDEIEALRTKMADVVVKENAEIVEGDTAVIDFDGYIDGKEFEGGKGENYPLEIGSNSFIPGFEEGLIGLKAGDKKDLNLTFPENYIEEYKGKDVTFKVTVNEVKTKVLPELDKDFFDDLGYEGVTDEESLKKHIKDELLEDKQHEADDTHLDKVLEKAISNMKVEIPEEIVEEETHRIIDDYANQLQQQGMDIDMYYQMTGTTHEDLHKQIEPEAERRVKYRYLIEAVADKEEINPTDEEVDARAKEVAESYGITVDELLKAYGTMDVVKYDLRMHNALEIIKDNN